MESYYAPPERKGEEELSREIDIVSRNAIVSGLLHTVSGILAVVNDKRQVVAMNHTFLAQLGIDNAEEQLGMRPGEILRCVHADEEPGGCGTSLCCRSCGAAVAMVTSLAEDRQIEKTCIIRSRGHHGEVDLVLNVRAHPIEIEARKFLLLFLQDITRQQQQAALERTFFHDINNMMSMLLGASELLQKEIVSPLVESIYQSALRLQNEIAIQRCLSDGEASYTPLWHMTTPGKILSELEVFFRCHPLAQLRTLRFMHLDDDTPLRTDISLTLRVLTNMITNALEAGEQDDEVKVWLERQDDNTLCFCVWNRAAISEDLQPRVFQRNFSTKKQSGRGLGTFSMKLLGEKILGGRVSFSSSLEKGTIFSLSLPL